MEPLNITLEPLRAFLNEVGAFMPRLLLGVFIALIGWLVAKALRFAVVKALRSINFHVLTERSHLDDFLQMGGTTADTSAVLGLLVYWLAVVAAMVPLLRQKPSRKPPRPSLKLPRNRLVKSSLESRR